MFRRIFLALALAALARAEARPGELHWPPVDGEVSGIMRLAALGDGWPITWRVKLRPPAAGALPFAVDLTATGFSLRALGAPPAGGKPGAWQVVEGSIDLTAGLPVATSHVDIAGLPPDLAITGELKFTGEGTWLRSEFSGRLTLTLSNGTAASPKQKWSASGLAFAIDATLEKNRPTVHALRFAVETLNAATLTARQLNVEAAGIEGGKLDVQRAEVSLLGGRVTLTPFTFDPAKPAIDTTADFIGVALGELAALVPQALAEASGRLYGRVAVRWNAQAGAEPGEGALRVAIDSAASVRLAPASGFLTNRVPRKLFLLPAGLGPLARWTAVDNPAYDTLRQIELGQMPLKVETLDVKLFPDGPDGPLSARVELVARPAEAGGAVDRVDFTVNVAGPLSQVLRVGLQSGASINVGAAR